MKSIKTKLSLSIALLVFAGFLLSVIAASVMSGKEMLAMEKEGLAVQASRYASEINGWLIEEKIFTEDTASSIALLGKIDETEIVKILKNNFSERAELLDMYFGTVDGQFWKASTASAVPEGYDPRERGWYKSAVEKGDVFVTDPYFDAFTFQMCDTIAVPVYFNGELAGVVGIDMTIDTVTSVASGIAYDDGVYAFVTDESGNFIYHPNEEYMPSEDNAVSAVEMIPDAKDIIQNSESDEVIRTVDYENNSIFIATAPIKEANWTIGVTIPRRNVEKVIVNLICVIVGISVCACAIVIVCLLIEVNAIVVPVNKMKDAAVKLAAGDFSITIDKARGEDEVCILQNSMSELISSVSSMLIDASNILGNIADGNLVVEDMCEYPGDFNQLSVSVNQIKHTLEKLIIMVKQASAEVHNGSTHLSMAADSLASATTTEASAVQKLTMNVDNISSMVNKSSTNCNEVNSKLSSLNKEIQSGNNAMAELYEAVSQIEIMSNDIQKIVNAIDSIAFQTNILALNASVEAARAGEKGRGFAVVAEEVRSLASKSAEESNKTAELIDNCLRAVTKAKEYADNASECLKGVVDHSKDIAVAFEDIASLANEEAENTNEILEEVNRVSDTVQSNSATAQETAAASEELTMEAEKLNEMVASFKTK